jgi:hypothetical protein
MIPKSIFNYKDSCLGLGTKPRQIKTCKLFFRKSSNIYKKINFEITHKWFLLFIANLHSLKTKYWNNNPNTKLNTFLIIVCLIVFNRWLIIIETKIVRSNRNLSKINQIKYLKVVPLLHSNHLQINQYF